MRLFSLLSQKPSWLENYLFPPLGIIFIIFIDRHIDSVLLTPFLSICLLGILSFRLGTWMLVFWFAILAVNVVFSLVDNPGIKGGAPVNVSTIIVRSIGFLVSGSIAVAMNRVRAKLVRNHRQLIELIERLPCAVVVSDYSGTMLFANKIALNYLGKTSGAVLGFSFFSFFSLPEQRGNAIQNYLRVGDQETPTETNLAVMNESGGNRLVRAIQIPLNLGDQRCVVSVIESDSDATALFASHAIQTS